MKLHSFQDLVTRIIHLSTRDGKSIPVSFSGENAYTTSKMVNIPALPSGTILNQNQFSIWLGYTIHEGPGHQTHTDLDLYAEICKKRNNPKFSYILNLLEDIRIENADIKKYPGDRKYLDAVHQFVDDKIPLELGKNPDTMGLIYKYLYVNHRNLNTNRISGTLEPKLSKLLSEIDSCLNTSDVIILADKVIKFLEENQEQKNKNQKDKNQEQEKEENQENSQSNNSSSSSSSNNNSKEENKEENKKEESYEESEYGLSEEKIKEMLEEDKYYYDSDEELKEMIEEAKKENENSQSNFKESETSKVSSENISENSFKNNFNFSENSAEIWNKLTEIKNILNYLKNQHQLEPELPQNLPILNLEGKSIFPPVNISLDRIYVPSAEDMPEYLSTRNSCSSQILALKKMFRIYLQAQTKKAQIRGLEEGKLDSQRLHIVSTGSNLIFKDSHTRPLVDTAIELMIDMSSSMNSNISRTAAIILAEALSSIPQIKLSISGFTTNDKYYHSYNYSENSGRQTPMDILQFKDFSEPYQKCRAKLGAITARGYTPLGDAYGKAFEHLISRTEPRKIIFLITDGQPAFDCGDNHSDFLLMKRIHQKAKSLKIQTLGLGIGHCEFLKNYFDEAINITDIKLLPQNLLLALKKFI